MEYRKLGNTSLTVSRLCFGSLTVGPLQSGLSVEDGGEVIAKALKMGINFIDTAQLYGTYPYIRYAIKKTGITPVISTKTYAYNAEMAREAVEEARTELDLDVIDIFMLHEQESEMTLKGHWEALEYLFNMKEKGIIRHVGISTHHIAAVRAVVNIPQIEVIHPMLNIEGYGISDGSMEQMVEAVEECKKAGKGVYGMKALAGGNLIKNYEKCMDFVLDLECIDSIAVGMQNDAEVEANISYFTSRLIPQDIEEKLSRQVRRLLIQEWCEGCGKCVKVCGQRAMNIIEGKAVVNPSLCVLCGYCGKYCELFAIKII